jgi:hypothetical protein
MRQLERDFAIDAVSDDGMTIYGLAMPFNRIATVSDFGGAPYDEMFRFGAFTKTIRERMNRIPLIKSHEVRDWGIGATKDLQETPDGLRGEWRLSDTDRGREASTLVRDGVLSGLSIGFSPLDGVETPGRSRAEGRKLVERTEVRLREVSLCTFPAYEMAGVTGQRSEAVRTLTELAEARQDLMDRFGRIRR